VSALAIVAARAAAQVGRPIPLVPSAPAPSAAPPAGNASGAATASPGAPAAAEPNGIHAVPLAPVDSSWMGTLSEGAGGLPHDMWRGTPRAFIAAALPQLAATTSPVLQELARRLLLTNAVSPAGQEPSDRPGLLGLRLERLAALGIVAPTPPLLAALPPAAAPDESRDRSRIELRFAAHDVGDACKEVGAHIGQYPDHWWDRALIACQALAGDHAKAALGLDLLREQKVRRDPAFEAMIASLGGRRHRVDKLPDPTPLTLDLLAATKEPLPADALAHAGPAALYAWATNPALSPEQRLAAAEEAARWGALAPAALGDLYTKIEPKPKEGTALLKDGKPPADPRSRAVLYQVARSAQEGEARATAIAALLAEARKDERFDVMARLLAPIIIELPTAGEPDGFSDEAARALIAAGKPDAALPWIAVTGAPPLMLLERLAAPQPAGSAGDDGELLRKTITVLASRDSAAAARQANLLVALLGAFDQPIGTLDWAPLLTPAHAASLPGAALWLDQAQAAAAKRVGETVLTTLLVATDGHRLSPEPIVLARAIRGLRAVGLEVEARSLAVEAAIDAGI
jgi:hypothetical protein